MRRAALPLVFALAFACGDDGGSAAAEGTGGDTTTGAVETDGGDETNDVADETSDDGTETGEEPEPLPDPPPVAPYAEPEEIEIDTWMIATVTDDSLDGVAGLIDTDAFELPAEGEYGGESWAPLTPGESGQLTNTSADLLYAATEIDVADDRYVFDRADAVKGMFANNAWEKPGDVYASGRYRFPLVTEAGTNLVVAQCYGRRGVPQVELFSTTDEVVFNFSDATLPQLRAGDGSDQWVGIPILNLRDIATRHVNARVMESADFEGTVVQYPSIAAGATTQLAFQLTPKQAWAADRDGDTVLVRLRVEPLWFDWSYEREVELTIVSDTTNHARTRRSNVDHSAQLYGLLPPPEVDPEADYGLILSLHGAGVHAPGQSNSYSAKDWAYLVAPTNRRRYGFDWEEWGRLDAIEAYDDAKANFSIDPTRTHLTGHSMGGHGSWNVGVHYPGLFGVIAPSAGWISFETYGGGLIGEGVEGRARASSRTREYVENFFERSIYIIHGLADATVPAAQAQTMYDLLEPDVAALEYHAQPGAGHWWNINPEAGADCVDWEPMISVMEQTPLDPAELDFEFVCAGPWVNPTHSYASIMSTNTPMEDSRLSSSADGDTVTLTTTNVRSLVLDAQILADQGVATVIVDGDSHDVTGDTIQVGPTEGKRAEAHGPLNQVFHRPWLFVYAEAGPVEYQEYASFLTSWWAAIGNGHAGAIALEQLTDDQRAAYNLIYLGIDTETLGISRDMQIAWAGGDTMQVAGADFTESALAFVFPEGEKLSAAWIATPGHEHLLFRYQPFSSRNGKPDYYLWQANGAALGGFFDGDWSLNPDFAGVL